jgi:signal recognition particle subunit SRP54
VEKAQATMDVEKARAMEKKMFSKSFGLQDFKEQLQQVKSMGPLDQIMEMIPGAGKMSKAMKNMQVDEKALDRIEAIIDSMTPKERQNPEIIGSSRKKRIAAGSGTRVQDVNQLLKQFTQMRKMMKQFGDMGKGRRGGMKFPF